MELCSNAPPKGFRVALWRDAYSSLLLEMLGFVAWQLFLDGLYDDLAVIGAQRWKEKIISSARNKRPGHACACNAYKRRAREQARR